MVWKPFSRGTCISSLHLDPTDKFSTGYPSRRRLFTESSCRH